MIRKDCSSFITAWAAKRGVPMDSPVSDRTERRALKLRWLRPGWPLYIAAVSLFGLWQGLNALIGMRSIGMRDVEVWKPFLWETSSVLVILALIPAIVWV